MTSPIKVNIKGADSLRLKMKSQDNLVLKSSLGSVGSTAISQLDDIDVTDLQDGSILVFSQANSKWTSTLQLEKQTVECGQY
jgi:hypothetical protein